MQSSSPVLTPTETCQSVHVPLPITSSLLRLSGPLNITFQHPQSAAPAAWTPVVGEQNLFVSRSPGGKKIKALCRHFANPIYVQRDLELLLHDQST